MYEIYKSSIKKLREKRTEKVFFLILWKNESGFSGGKVLVHTQVAHLGMGGKFAFFGLTALWNKPLSQSRECAAQSPKFVTRIDCVEATRDNSAQFSGR